MPKVKTLQINDRLIIMDGVSPLRYVDLTTNKVHVYKKKPKVKYTYKVTKNDPVIDPDIINLGSEEHPVFVHKDAKDFSPYAGGGYIDLPKAKDANV